MTELWFYFSFTTPRCFSPAHPLRFILLSRGGACSQRTAEAADWDGLLSEREEKKERCGEESDWQSQSGVADWMTAYRPSSTFYNLCVYGCVCVWVYINLQARTIYQHGEDDTGHTSLTFLQAPRQRKRQRQKPDSDHNSPSGLHWCTCVPEQHPGSTGGSHNRIIFRPPIHHS